MCRSLFVLLALPASLLAQARRAPVVSPEVAADGKVTLRVAAPKAEKVALDSGDLAAALAVKDLPAMTKGDGGVWAVTVGPVPPGIYEYAFKVDGVTMTDPNSPNVFGDRTGSRGFVEIPGPAGAPRADAWRKVPHGSVHAHWYESSAAAGARRRVHVYTPPGYEKDSRKYPVLYLLHGSGDNDSHWTLLGRANVIADNAIADGKAVPMLIVMPDGHVPTTGDRTAAFETDLMKDVRPLVEGSYRVETDRTKRAITGLSMGGAQALAVGLKHADDFAYVGAFSAGLREGSPAYAALNDPAKLNDRLKLLWVGIGTDDFLLKANRDFEKKLDAAKVRHEYKETPGGHRWGVWRDYLAEFLPRLFRD